MYTLDWIEVHAVDHCNNTCAWCNNSSPFAPRTEHAAADYVPWLEKLLGMARINWISIMGGEPFLHRDLAGFIAPLRALGKKILLTTNASWLSERGLDRHAEALALADKVFVSLYPNIARRLGGPEAVDRLLNEVRQAHPAVEFAVRDQQTFQTFSFTSDPTPISAYCPAAECTCLLPGGRLARCGVGAFAALNPRATREFLAADHMFHDLADPAEDFWMWRKRWPLDSCRFCTHHAFELKPWQADPLAGPRAAGAPVPPGS